MVKTLLSTGQAAKLCSVTPDTVLKWIRAGRLPAQRTPGGHHRVDSRELERLMRPAHRPTPSLRLRPVVGPAAAFRFCWDFNAGGDGELQGRCRECLVYTTRAQRCYEVARLAPEVGHTMTFCQETCDDCDYFRQVHEQGTNVLVVSDDLALTAALQAEAACAPFRLEVADCEYTCSALVDAFRPDFAIVDCSLGEERSGDIRRHLVEDPRVPLVRLILASHPGELPDVCDEEVFAVLTKPFATDDIVACIRGIPDDGRYGNVWAPGARADGA